MNTRHDRPPQFGLRTLLIAILVLSLPLSWFAVKLERARRQREAARTVLALEGSVDYEWTFLIPSSWREMLGDDFFDKVNSVSLKGTPAEDADLECLRHLGHFWGLDLRGTQITDEGLKHLAGLANLRALTLTDTHVTPEGVEEFRKTLPNCRIDF